MENASAGVTGAETIFVTHTRNTGRGDDTQRRAWWLAPSES